MNRSMMPQQIMRLAGGGGISSFIPRNTTIMGQPHYLAYINPQEGQLLKDLGGAGLPGPGGVPAYWELFKPSTWGDGQGYQGTGLNLGGGSTSTSDKDDDDDDSGPTLSASAAAQVNDVRQDENGNWYAVTQIEGTNALGRDYSIDPKDNSQGPTFGGNVSENIKENFSEEVEEAGGSTEPGSILDTFKNTDVSSLGYDKETGSFVDINEVEEELAKEEGGTTVRRKDGKYYTKYADGTYSDEVHDTALDAYYAQSDRENSLGQTITNLVTPFNDTEYVGGVLVNKDTGQPVDEAALLSEMGVLDQSELPALEASSASDKKALQQAYASMQGSGVLSIGGKQVPEGPDNVGNTPIFTYTGGDDPSYEVFGGLDSNADPSMSYNEDNSLFVPYDGKDPYSFDASTNFPGSTDPNSPNYNMSKDLAETGSYYTFEFDESGEPKTDSDGNYIIDQSQKIESGPFEDGDFPIFEDNEIATLNEQGKELLLNTGDDSKMIVIDDGEYKFLGGGDTGVGGYDATGGGATITTDPVDGSTVLEQDLGGGNGDGNGGGNGDGNGGGGNGGGGGGGGGNGGGTEDGGTDDGGTGEGEVSPITTLPFLGSNFYGGYQPVTASDVLVQNPNVGIPYVPTTDPRFMPIFQQGADIDKQLGIASLFSDPASAAMYQGIMS